MVFCILAVVTLAAVVYLVWPMWGEFKSTVDGFFLGILGTAIAGMLGCALIFVIITLTGMFIPSKIGSAEETSLRALATSDSIEGRSYFLGAGYIKDKRVLNYIYEQDGYFMLGQSDASASRIIEDEEDHPYMVTYTWVKDEWWFAPFAVPARETFDFHIPAGSVTGDYLVSNG